MHEQASDYFDHISAWIGLRHAFSRINLSLERTICVAYKDVVIIRTNIFV